MNKLIKQQYQFNMNEIFMDENLNIIQANMLVKKK